MDNKKNTLQSLHLRIAYRTETVIPLKVLNNNHTVSTTISVVVIQYRKFEWKFPEKETNIKINSFGCYDLEKDNQKDETKIDLELRKKMEMEHGLAAGDKNLWLTNNSCKYICLCLSYSKGCCGW